MQGVEFDPAAHTYRLDGAKAPGVTRILAGALRFADVPPAILAAACQRGTAIHKATELIDNGQVIDAQSLDPRLKPWLAQYDEFLLQTGYQPIATERMVAHRQLKYCGQLDKLGTLAKIRGRKPGLDLIDLKCTAQLPLTTGVQTAGYAGALVDEIGTAERVNRWCLWLRPDRWKLVPYESPSDWAYFASFLNTWRFCDEHGLT